METSDNYPARRAGAPRSCTSVRRSLAYGSCPGRYHPSPSRGNLGRSQLEYASVAGSMERLDARYPPTMATAAEWSREYSDLNSIPSSHRIESAKVGSRARTVVCRLPVAHVMTFARTRGLSDTSTTHLSFRVILVRGQLVRGPPRCPCCGCGSPSERSKRATGKAGDALVRVCYRHAPAPARVTPERNWFSRRVLSPQRAMTPGQAAAVYREDEVVGSGIIA